MKKRGVIAGLLLCGVALADDAVNEEPPNEIQKAKVGAAALSHGVDECIHDALERDSTHDTLTMVKFCGCMFDYQRSSVKDDAKKLRALGWTFDPSEVQKQISVCMKWGEQEAKTYRLALETPYSKKIDLPTEVILTGFGTCNGTLETQQVPENNRLGYCGCIFDVMRAQPAATLAKVRESRGKDFGAFIPADKIAACKKRHDMMKYAPQ
jgi:hypothetical protein